VTGTRENPRARGRPRSARAHKAILTAAIELLLAQGLHAMSMDDVAELAGVSKATIYRWWPSKEMLALDALATEWAVPKPIAERDSGSLRGDLLARFRPWLRRLNQKPYERIIAGLVAQATTDPKFAKVYREHFVQPRREETRVLLVRAIDRGEIAADTNLEVTLDLLYGPIYHRLLHGHAPLTDRFAQQVIDAVIAALTCGGLAEGSKRTAGLSTADAQPGVGSTGTRNPKPARSR
jgi:AcrR family transcriptional regulator